MIGNKQSLRTILAILALVIASSCTLRKRQKPDDEAQDKAKDKTVAEVPAPNTPGGSDIGGAVDPQTQLHLDTHEFQFPILADTGPAAVDIANRPLAHKKFTGSVGENNG
jgi:hypothetical protein